MQQAFSKNKQALTKAIMLVHPDMNVPIALSCDASDIAVDAVLEQYQHGQWQPLAFFSRQLRTPEQKYSTFDRELLGIHLAVRHFRFMLEGRQFVIYTDHKPLVHAMAKSTDPVSSLLSLNTRPTFDTFPEKRTLWLIVFLATTLQLILSLWVSTSQP